MDNQTLERLYKLRAVDTTQFTLTQNEKEHIARLVIDGVMTVNEVKEKWNLSGRTVYNWVAGFRERGRLNPRFGRPPTISRERALEAQEVIRNVVSDSKSLRRRDIPELLKKATVLTAQDRGGTGLGVSLPKRTKNRYTSSLNMGYTKGKKTTKARDIAVRDIRNVVSSFTGYITIASGADPSNVANLDSTQVAIVGDDNNELAYINDDRFKRSGVEVEGIGESPTVIFIKIYTLIVADGSMFPLLFVVADDSLAEGEIVWYSNVAGLSHLAGPGNSGHILFAHSRAGTEDFFVEYFIKVVFPEIQERMPFSPHPEEDEFILSFDGESAQINAAVSDDVYPVAEDARCLLMKNCASCSAVQNACDQNLYKAVKGVLRHMYGDYEGATALTRSMNDIFRQRTSLSANAKRKIKSGIHKIIYAFQKSINPTLVKECFSDIGVVPLDFNRMMGLCKEVGKLTPDDLTLIRDAIPILSDIFLETGQVTEADLDEAGIPQTIEPGSIPKDTLTTMRQRTIWVNHGDTRARHKEYKSKQASKKQVRAEGLQNRPTSKSNVFNDPEQVKLLKSLCCGTHKSIDSIANEFLRLSHFIPPPSRQAIRSMIPIIAEKLPQSSGYTLRIMDPGMAMDLSP